MGVLLMLMTIGVLAFAAVVLIVSLLTGSRWLRNFILGSVAIWLISYYLILLFVSFYSTERILAVGDAKEYCGFYLDCHLHTAVTGVRLARSIGNRTANGEFYIVKVKVVSDANRATLGILTVDARIHDAQGNRYERVTAAEEQLYPQPDFERQLSPTESFEKEIVFDLPNGVNAPRLDIREGYGIDHFIEAFLIGDEDSLLHKRIYFQLPGQSQMAEVN